MMGQQWSLLMIVILSVWQVTFAQLSGSNPQVTNSSKGFKVYGSKIYDPFGREFICKGVNVGGPGWVWSETTIDQFDGIVNKWRFNTSRIATLGGPSLDSYTSFDCPGVKFPDSMYASFGTLRAIIKKYTDAKVVVIIEWHKVGSIYTGAELACAAKWWAGLAEEYMNNTYVWFDLYNEPKIDNRTWAASFQAVTNAIRSTGNKNIIMVSGNSWGQDAGTWSCENVPEDSSAILSKSITDFTGNIIYSLHVYEQWMQCQSKMENYLDRIKAKGKCVIIGEYGVFNNMDVSSAVSYTLAATQPRKIGRIAWAWWGGDKNDLVTSGNGGGQNSIYDAKGDPVNTTAFGKAVINDLRRKETLEK